MVIFHLPGQHQFLPHVFDSSVAELAGKIIDQGGSEAHRFGHVAEGGTRSVGDDIGHHGGMLGAVPILNVRDHLIAAARVEVDIDIGHADPCRD